MRFGTNRKAILFVVIILLIIMIVAIFLISKSGWYFSSTKENVPLTLQPPLPPGE